MVSARAATSEAARAGGPPPWESSGARGSELPAGAPVAPAASGASVGLDSPESAPSLSAA